MRVALAQLNPVSGDIDGNADKICEAIAEAARQGADLLVSPEMVLPGYCIGDLVENVDFLAANDRAIARIAEASRGITSVVGFIDYDLHQRNDNGTVRKYNAAAVVRDGRILQRAHKALLPNYRYFDDKRFFAPGESREPVEIPTASGSHADRRLDLRGHVGRLLRRQTAAGARRQGRDGHREPERLTLLSRQAARA